MCFYIYTGSDRCPVRIYREYSTRRPFESNNSESRFYLRPKRNISEKVWFDNAPLGKNKICDIAKNMAKNAGLEGRKTNHSGRHTAVNMLSKSGLADSTIAKHTGHKNVEGLKPYKSLDLDTQKNISRILMEKASHAPSTSNTTMDQQATCSINSSVNYTLGSQLPSLPSSLLHGSTIHGNVSIRFITNTSSNPQKRKREEFGNENSDSE